VSGYYKDHGMPIQRGRFYIYASIFENDLFQYMVIDPASIEESLSDPPSKDDTIVIDIHDFILRYIDN
jgi:hypothetical protein